VVAIHSGDSNARLVVELDQEDNDDGRAICQSRDNKFLAVGDSGGNLHILNV
jgi:hypothetical protein